MKFHRLYDILGPDKAINALIILNGPELDPYLLDLVWPVDKHVSFPRICADGGANLLYELTHKKRLSSSKPPHRERAPSHIVGDLDSIRPAVLNHYTTLGAHITKDESVMSNDFEKALAVANSLQPSSSDNVSLPIVVLGGYNGRLDQTLGNLNTLYMAAERAQDVVWLSERNAALALSPGRHHVTVDPTCEGPVTGLIPVGRRVDCVSTEGLRWNLDQQPLAYGKDGLVSSSNEILEQSFVVETSHPLLWTIELHLSS